MADGSSATLQADGPGPALLQVVMPDAQPQQHRKMAHILVLDRSGSMSGGPWSEVQAATAYIESEAKKRAKKGDATSVKYIMYESSAYEATYADVQAAKARGGTNFVAAYNEIVACISRSEAAESYVVSFLTDGEANHDHEQDAEMAKLQQYLCTGVGGAQTVVHTIGFGHTHDLSLLEKLRLCGSKEGYYRYCEGGGRNSASISSKFADLFDFVSSAVDITYDIGGGAIPTLAHVSDGKIVLEAWLESSDPTPASVRVRLGTGDSVITVGPVQIVPADALFPMKVLERDVAATVAAGTTGGAAAEAVPQLQGRLDAFNPFRLPKAVREVVARLPPLSRHPAGHEGIAAKASVQAQIDMLHSARAEESRTAGAAARLADLRYAAVFSKARRQRAVDVRAAANAAVLDRIQAEIESFKVDDGAFDGVDLQLWCCDVSHFSTAELVEDGDVLGFGLSITERSEHVIDAPQDLRVASFSVTLVSRRTFEQALRYQLPLQGPKVSTSLNPPCRATSIKAARNNSFASLLWVFGSNHSYLYVSFLLFTLVGQVVSHDDCSLFGVQGVHGGFYPAGKRPPRECTPSDDDGDDGWGAAPVAVPSALSGRAREPVNAWLPLYVCASHFELVRLQLQPALGLLVALDPLAYAPSQLLVLYTMLGHMQAHLDAPVGRPQAVTATVGERQAAILADYRRFCQAMQPEVLRTVLKGADPLRAFVSSAAGRTKAVMHNLLTVVGWAIASDDDGAAIAALRQPLLEEHTRRQLSAYYRNYYGSTPPDKLTELVKQLLYGVSEEVTTCKNDLASKLREKAAANKKWQGDKDTDKAFIRYAKTKLQIVEGPEGVCPEFEPAGVALDDFAVPLQPDLWNDVIEDTVRKLQSRVDTQYLRRAILLPQIEDRILQKAILVNALTFSTNMLANQGAASGKMRLAGLLLRATVMCILKAADDPVAVLRDAHVELQRQRSLLAEGHMREMEAMHRALLIVYSEDMWSFCGRLMAACPLRGGRVFLHTLSLLKRPPSQLPLHKDKVEVVLLGTYAREGEAERNILSLGAPMRVSKRERGQLERAIGAESMAAILAKMIGRIPRHVYRCWPNDSPNRHGHCNSKPSQQVYEEGVIANASSLRNLWDQKKQTKSRYMVGVRVYTGEVVPIWQAGANISLQSRCDCANDQMTVSSG
eukprot:SM000044S15948  [mRNA]  locus=s44:145927:153991:- [translate_table: standard]